MRGDFINLYCTMIIVVSSSLKVKRFWECFPRFWLQFRKCLLIQDQSRLICMLQYFADLGSSSSRYLLFDLFQRSFITYHYYLLRRKVQKRISIKFHTYYEFRKLWKNIYAARFASFAHLWFVQFKQEIILWIVFLSYWTCFSNCCVIFEDIISSSLSFLSLLYDLK